jgi:transcription elongation factor GreA
MRVPFRRPKKINHVKLDYCVTKDKFDDLNNKLNKLKQYTQHEAISEVSRLAELGDFSENVEYQLAKGRLRGINNTILKLENVINNASIITPNQQNDTIKTGHSVIVEHNGNQKKYQILGSAETNPEQGIISHNSPLGSALIGCRVGETIKIKLNNKEAKYKIIKIE